MNWRIQLFQEQRVFNIVEGIMAVAVIVAISVLVAEYGFGVIPRENLFIRLSIPGLVGIFLIGGIVQLIITQDRREFLRHNKIKYSINLLFLILIIGLQIGHWTGRQNFTNAQEVVFRLYLVLHIVRKFLRVSQYLAQYNISPPRFIVGSFGGLILIGAVLLMLPAATTGAFSWIDALFTATSAVCVTGLIVVDTANAFTRIGQWIILGLLQLGGLGIMTVTAFFTLIIGQRMSGREQVLMGNVLSTNRPAQLGSIIRAVLLMTFVIEFCGTLILYFSWKIMPDVPSPWYAALFHSVSAFCNAGFSIFSDSLMKFSGHIPINLTICGLIILGGLGFGTLRNLESLFSSGTLRQKLSRVTVQSKIVLTMTFFLLLAGMLLFVIVEFSNVLKGVSWGERLLASFFQSVTCRTAGFNTVDFSQLRPPTLLLCIILMFIGAAPGSTGGGIKVTTLAILVGTVVSTARGSSRLEFFRRTIPVKVLYQTIVVVTVYLFVALLISFLLSITEPTYRSIELIFETVSALGTVGLSAGVTPHLSPAGKILIIITMFLGRIGPFTLALAIGRQQLTAKYRYPEEEVQIG